MLSYPILPNKTGQCEINLFLTSSLVPHAGMVGGLSDRSVHGRRGGAGSFGAQPHQRAGVAVEIGLGRKGPRDKWQDGQMDIVRLPTLCDEWYSKRSIG